MGFKSDEDLKKSGSAGDRANYDLIQNAKSKWIKADATGDAAGKQAAKNEANAVRAVYGYNDGLTSGPLVSVTPESPTNPRKVQRSAGLGSSFDYAKRYGMTIDQDAIKSVLDKATAAEFATKRQEYAKTADDFVNNLGAVNTNVQDALRKERLAAAVTGASENSALAAALSTALGLQQESTQGATDLATERNKLVSQEAEAYAKNAEDALNTSNQLRQAIMSGDLNKYATDTSFDVGTLEYLKGLYQADKQLEGVKDTNTTNVYNNERNREANLTIEGNKIASAEYIQQLANQNNIDVQQLKNIIAKYEADKQHESARYNANTNLKIAQMNANGGGNSSYSGSGTSSGGDGSKVYNTYADAAKARDWDSFVTLKGGSASDNNLKADYLASGGKAEDFGYTYLGNTDAYKDNKKSVYNEAAKDSTTLAVGSSLYIPIKSISKYDKYLKKNSVVFDTHNTRDLSILHNSMNK